jgi:NADH-quinone oxidoreductase subunit I
MPIAESDVKWVEAPKIGLVEQLYLPAIFEGIATTVRHARQAVFGRGAITQQFPEQRPQLPAIYRGVHRLNRDEQGRVKCVACYMCSTACPAHCIDIVAAPSPWPDREKYPETFVIDELRCIYCGMCEQACPVDAIELTTLADLTGLSREEMMFDKEKLLSVFDQTVKMGADPVRSRAGRLSVASELPDNGLARSSTAESG